MLKINFLKLEHLNRINLSLLFIVINVRLMQLQSNNWILVLSLLNIFGFLEISL